MTYTDCKQIAQERASRNKITIDKAYSIGNDYVFDSSETDAPGIIPMVVRTENGECWGIWEYINHFDMTMDDMVEIPFEDKE